VSLGGTVARFSVLPPLKSKIVLQLLLGRIIWMEHMMGTYGALSISLPTDRFYFFFKKMVPIDIVRNPMLSIHMHASSSIKTNVHLV
jgi:hypothetical protein